jgi:hypothetical protein
MANESPPYLQAAGDYLASIGAAGLDPAVRDDMVNMADLAVFLLLSQWLTALQDDEPNSMQVVESLGDLGQALLRELQHGEGESLLEAVYASNDHILFEGLLALGIAAIKYLHWQARQAGRTLEDGYLDEAVLALVRLTIARYLQAPDEERAAYRASLTPHRFAAALLEEVRAQAGAQGLDLEMVARSEHEHGENAAPDEEASGELTPDEFLAMLRQNETPAETIADIMVDAFKPLLARNARPQYKQYGRGAVVIDLRGPEVLMMFVTQSSLGLQAGQEEAFRAIAALTTTYDPLRQLIAVVLQPESVFYYQLDYDEQENGD